jgi:hypothetical protein
MGLKGVKGAPPDRWWQSSIENFSFTTIGFEREECANY